MSRHGAMRRKPITQTSKGKKMNKYLKLHIDQASKATRRHYNVARIVAKLIGMIVAAYVVMIGLWWCITVFFAMTP